MSIPLMSTLVALGLGGGFLSGLLGLGGAIFMIPLLLYVPPLLGLGQFDMKQVAAISMVQVLAASLTGVLAPDELEYNKPVAVGASLAIGTFGGMVGAPGAFVYIPVMIYLLKIPTRIVIGSTLGIVFLGAIAGTIGKMATGQIVWPAAVALVAGTVPGAQLGGNMSKKVQSRYLRIAIAVIIAVTGIKMWHQIALP